MISKVVFKKIKFNNIDPNKFKKYITKNGLFVFPAGPALATINNSNQYYKSIQRADFVFFDSGFFVLLLKIFKNIKVHKFSGYKFLNLFFVYLKKNKKKKLFCIDPNIKFSNSNNLYIKNLGVKNVYNYIAPQYSPNKLIDKKLLKLINKTKPEIIMINIGGGIQEILGLYLKKKLNIKPTILCTGAAISFFTGDQAPINSFVDKYYLGWLIRLIYNPTLFFKRYFLGLKLIPMVIFNKIITIK
jgi:N-acetylglucosaminyldiphosphoundecaprenol N-acetyl-beta-D-mannosaminyltransferase